MSPHEVYRRPTVKNVIFQIKFPNLFFMESIVPDFQKGVMAMFPQSSLAIRRQFVIADVGPEWKKQDIPDELETMKSAKIWQFKSDSGVELNITNDSLDVSTSSYKTYNNPEEKERFRDVLDFVLQHFFGATNIQQLSRVGLRYIDESPMPPAKNNESFKEYYDTTFALERFNIKDAKMMFTRTEVARGEYFMTLIETLGKSQEDESEVLILDFDACAINVKSSECLPITDNLQELIHDEWQSFVKDPVRDWMRQDDKEVQ